MPDMTNAEAIELLELNKRLSSHGLLDDLVNALEMAIAALTSPGWIRTADRKMTLADADDDGCLPVIVRCKKTKEVRRAHQHVYDKFDLMGWECLAFLPLPALPEVEG